MVARAEPPPNSGYRLSIGILWRPYGTYSAVAQLAEQWTVNPLVVGSSPTRGALHLPGVSAPDLGQRYILQSYGRPV